MARQDNAEFDDSSQATLNWFSARDLLESTTAQKEKWNCLFGKVTLVREMGSLTVNIGSDLLKPFPRILEAIDGSLNEWPDAVNRVLRLRTLGLDEIEERVLTVVQQRKWFTSKHLIHRGNTEKLYRVAKLYKAENPPSIGCRSP